MIRAVFLFIVGLILLIKGGDWFVDGATAVAEKFHVPELIIGATVVSIGTTLPEVLVSATAAATGHGQMAYGNAIGSIICNTALIAALTIAIKPSKCERKSLITPVIFFFGAALFYSATAYISGNFSRIVGIILLTVFVIYMFILIRKAVKESKNPVKEIQPEEKEKITKKPRPFWMEIVFLAVGAAMIALGANLLVENGTFIATELGVPETVISLTFVALGTSLPELVTAITALAKGHGALSLGNICGANLFNLVLVSGLSISIGPFSFENAGFEKMTVAGHSIYSSLLVDTPLMLLVMLILTIPALVKEKLARWQGILLLLIYVSFCAFQFVIV